MSDPIHPCTCGHGIDDHQPVHDVWLIGARTVTETREECTLCDCDDFEETAPPCADCGRTDGGCDRVKEPWT